MNIDELVYHASCEHMSFEESLEGAIDKIKSFTKKVYDKIIQFFTKVKNFFAKLFGGTIADPKPLDEVKSDFKEGEEVETVTSGGTNEDDVSSSSNAGNNFTGETILSMGATTASLRAATTHWSSKTMDALRKSAAAGNIDAAATMVADRAFWEGVASSVKKLGAFGKVVSPVGNKFSQMTTKFTSAIKFPKIFTKKSKPPVSAMGKIYASATTLFSAAKNIGKKVSADTAYDHVVKSLKSGLNAALSKIGRKEPTKAQKAAAEITKAYGVVLSAVKSMATIDFKVLKYVANVMKTAKAATISFVKTGSTSTESYESKIYVQRGLTVPNFY